MNRLFCSNLTSEDDPYDYLYVPNNHTLWFIRYCYSFLDWGSMNRMNKALEQDDWAMELFYEIK